MVLADFECIECGQVEEHFVSSDDQECVCVECGGVSKRIISIGRSVFLGNESPAWIKSVIDVVDKDNPAPHVQNFVKNPTRDNYKAWMKGEKIRPADYTVRGAPPVYERPKTVSREELADQVYNRLRARRRLEVR